MLLQLVAGGALYLFMGEATDALMLLSAVFVVFESEKEDEHIMKRRPRDLHSTLFNSRNVAINLLQGFGVLIATFSLYMFSIYVGKGEYEARSFAFASLVIANILLIVVNLSWSKNIFQILFTANRILLVAVFGAIFCLLVVLNIPFVADLFHVTALHFNDYLLIIATVLISLSWFEVLKLFNNVVASQRLRQLAS